MSAFHELLITIDDQTEISLDSLKTIFNEFTLQHISSILGRMTQRGWIERIEKNHKTKYRLAPEGDRYLNHSLENLRRHDMVWDGTWQIMVFSISEEQRSARDLMRVWLIEHGFGKLIDGCWLTPWDREQEVYQEARRLEIGTSVFVFKTKSVGQATTQYLVQKAWDWPALNQALLEIINSVEIEFNELKRHTQINNPDREHQIRFRIGFKNLVFNIAHALERYPNFPGSLSPNDEINTKITRLYHELRPYCYQ